MILFLPLVGSLIYVYIHIYNARKVGQVKEGMKQTFVKNYKINQLEKELQFADTFSNKMELAEEHSRVGNYSRAIQLYESCNTGLHKDDSQLLLNLIKNQYLLENHKEVVKYGSQLRNEKIFAHSKEKAAYAWALYRTGDEDASERVFKELDVSYANYDNRLEYAYFLEESNRKEEAVDLLVDLLEEINVMDSYEKKMYSQSIKQIKNQYQKLSRA